MLFNNFYKEAYKRSAAANRKKKDDNDDSSRTSSIKASSDSNNNDVGVSQAKHFDVNNNEEYHKKDK